MRLLRDDGSVERERTKTFRLELDPPSRHCRRFLASRTRARSARNVLSTQDRGVCHARDFTQARRANSAQVTDSSDAKLTRRRRSSAAWGWARRRRHNPRLWRATPTKRTLAPKSACLQLHHGRGVWRQSWTHSQRPVIWCVRCQWLRFNCVKLKSLRHTSTMFASTAVRWSTQCTSLRSTAALSSSHRPPARCAPNPPIWWQSRNGPAEHESRHVEVEQSAGNAHKRNHRNPREQWPQFVVL